uniref:Uncharacterized protein n=1 Tax=Opuntia streptacantha TaxID=393608 RepID=A0A7C9CMX3_OPUST
MHKFDTTAVNELSLTRASKPNSRFRAMVPTRFKKHKTLKIHPKLHSHLTINKHQFKALFTSATSSKMNLQPLPMKSKENGRKLGKSKKTQEGSIPFAEEEKRRTDCSASTR